MLVVVTQSKQAFRCHGERGVARGHHGGVAAATRTRPDEQRADPCGKGRLRDAWGTCTPRGCGAAGTLARRPLCLSWWLHCWLRVFSVGFFFLFFPLKFIETPRVQGGRGTRCRSASWSLCPLPSLPGGVQILPDGGGVCAGSSGGRVQLWGPPGPGSGVPCLCCLPSGCYPSACRHLSDPEPTVTGSQACTRAPCVSLRCASFDGGASRDVTAQLTGERSETGWHLPECVLLTRPELTLGGSGLRLGLGVIVAGGGVGVAMVVQHCASLLAAADPSSLPGSPPGHLGTQPASGAAKTRVSKCVSIRGACAQLYCHPRSPCHRAPLLLSLRRSRPGHPAGGPLGTLTQPEWVSSRPEMDVPRAPSGGRGAERP